ncbi:hypothetical protein M426DRAFT_26861 [Hypoxylon sp. CI-4A]|nr:hypothetical protein M426DRAFT_26861 [Hypoxylon sp. CI-4A]
MYGNHEAIFIWLADPHISSHSCSDPTNCQFPATVDLQWISQAKKPDSFKSCQPGYAFSSGCPSIEDDTKNTSQTASWNVGSDYSTCFSGAPNLTDGTSISSYAQSSNGHTSYKLVVMQGDVDVAQEEDTMSFQLYGSYPNQVLGVQSVITHKSWNSHVVSI